MPASTGKSFLPIPRCTNVEFPQYPIVQYRTLCYTPLVQQILGSKKLLINKPLLQYPVMSIQWQLTNLFNRPYFEQSMCQWTARDLQGGILGDIYKGRI